MVGFSDLGNTDEFSTEMLEWRLAHVSDLVKRISKLYFTQAEVINYSGDLNTPPDQAERKKTTNFVGKKLKGKKGRNDDESSDENDW